MSGGVAEASYLFPLYKKRRRERYVVRDDVELMAGLEPATCCLRIERHLEFPVFLEWIYYGFV